MFALIYRSHSAQIQMFPWVIQLDMESKYSLTPHSVASEHQVKTLDEMVSVLLVSHIPLFI